MTAGYTYVYQTLQQTTERHNVLHCLVIELHYVLEAPIQKDSKALLYHVRAGHEPEQSSIKRQGSDE